MSTNTIDELFYCHICSVNVSAMMTPSLEWTCMTCSSPFVERLGQDIDGFLTNIPPPPPPPPVVEPHSVESILQIMNARQQRATRIDGNTNINNPNTNNIGTNDRTMSYTVRQVTAPQDIDSITSLLLGSMRTADHPSPTVPGATPTGVPAVPARAIPLPFHNTLPLPFPRQPLSEDARILRFGQERIGLENAGFRAFAEGIIGNIGTFTGNNFSFDDILHHILMHESSHAGRPPASAELIDSLCRVVVTDENVNEMDECNITLEHFEIGDVAVKLTCGHMFKEDAIIQWLRMHNSCPICRVEICGTTNNTHHDSDDDLDGDDSDSDSDDDSIPLPSLIAADSDSD